MRDVALRRRETLTMHAQHLREILTMSDVAHRRRETLKVMRVAHRRPIRVETNPRHRLSHFNF